MPRSLAAALAILIATFPDMAAAQTWQPKGKWTVDDAETGCILSREFSSNGLALSFAFQPWLTGRGGKIVLTSSDPKLPRHPLAVLTLLPGHRTFDLALQDRRMTATSADLTLTIDGSDLLAGFDTAAGVRIGLDGQTIDLATGPLAGASMALRRCRDDRLKSYGLDPATVVPLPAGALLSALRPEDYPLDAIRAGAQGRALIAMSFGADGKPVTCRIAESSGARSLDLASCAAGFRLTLGPVTAGPATRWAVVPVRWVLGS